MHKPENGMYILLISVHGLIRSSNWELGRDADNGGQIKYVVELAQALGKHPDVARVDLVTRLIHDKKVSPDYAVAEESISDKVTIVRMPCGPRRYLRKEVLWPYLDGMVDNILSYVRRVGLLPDVVHAHYADAGYVGSSISQLLGIPLIFTGHSLGKVKKQRLQEKGSRDSVIESQYNMSTRIEAEEITLGNANLVITSTRQEVEQQYKQYDNYQPRRMTVIAPGVDIEKFDAARSDNIVDLPIYQAAARFFSQPDKPVILAISRLDERKNILSLVRAYGESEALQQCANLLIIAGTRDKMSELERGSREILLQMLELIDDYDLYGKVAYPKQHKPQDVQDAYYMAKSLRGVFINPALTEPFGLTLIEAAAAGVPIIAPQDGGPRDIIGHCENGLLIDPLDIPRMSQALLEVLQDKNKWQQWSQNGLQRVTHFSWSSHVNTYVKSLQGFTANARSTDARLPRRSRIPTMERLIVCNIDHTLLGDEEGLSTLIETISNSRGKIGLAVATGRNIDKALEMLNDWSVPMPDILITAVGSEIYYGESMIKDRPWEQHINYRWQPGAIRDALSEIPGLNLQSEEFQRQFKICFTVDAKIAPSMREIRRLLRKRDLHTKLIFSHNSYLDVLPLRASKGLAVRHIMIKWGISPDRILVAGDSGNDEDMLKGNTLGVVVGNHSAELSRLKGRPHVYFANSEHAWAILEGMRNYGFLQYLEQDDAGHKASPSRDNKEHA